MPSVTIPKNLAKKGDLVVIPSTEYKELLAIRKIKEFRPTKALKSDLQKAIRNLKAGRSLSYNELVKKLGSKN